MKFVSLFSGIGGFDLGFEQAGFESAWQVEIDKDCQRLLSKHWPSVKRFDDVSKVSQLPRIDVLCGGFPCQDLSVAGKREGLAGERSGLWFEFLRIAQVNKPEWVVVENVPGLLSSNEGDDLGVILDGLEDAGYVVEMDILDAQWFGVAQRRRRVFLVCQLAECLLNKKTNSSCLTIAQCLTENLLLVLIAARSPSAINLENLAFSVGEPVLSLSRRMKLFGMQKAEAAQTLALSLAALPRSCDCGRDCSESPRGKNTPEDSKTSKAIRSLESTKSTGRAEECQNTEPSWKSILEDLLPMMSECITSTLASEITESKIYSCALLTLNIARRITQSPPSCPTFWSAALSSLTALEAFTEYARQAGSSLFTDANWLQPWHDFIGQALPVCKSLRSVGVGSFDQVFPLSEGVSWNPPTRGEARQGTPEVSVRRAPTSSNGWGVRTDGSTGTLDGTGGDAVITHQEIVGPLMANAATDRKHGDGGISALDQYLAGHIVPSVTHALRSEGADASEDGTGRGTPLVAWPAEVSPPLDGSWADRMPGSTNQEWISQRGGRFIPDIVPSDVELWSQTCGCGGDFIGPHCGTIREGFTHGDPIVFDERNVTSKANRSNPHPGDPPRLIAFSSKDHGADAGEIAPTMRSQNFKDSHINGGGQMAVAFESRVARNGRGAPSDIVPPLKAESGQTSKGDSAPLIAFDWQSGDGGTDESFQGKSRSYIVRKGEYAQLRSNARDAVQSNFGVRRLTPRECERLQGFPDDFTRWDASGKEISDSARYRMLGNAICVNVAEWIGKRIVAAG